MNEFDMDIFMDMLDRMNSCYVIDSADGYTFVTDIGSPYAH